MLISETLRRFRPVYAMDGEGVGGAAAEVEAAIAAVGAEPEELDMTEVLEPEAEGEPEAAPDLEDFDLDGVGKIKIPKGKQGDVERYLLREADYTKKTMALAAKERETETARTRYDEQRMQDATLAKGELHLENIDADLGKRYQYFQSPEYRELREVDPLKARGLYDDFQMDKDKREAFVGILRNLHQERTDKLAAEAKAQTEAEATRRAALPREIAKIIPGWTPEMMGKVKEFGVSLGYAPEALDSSTDPLHFKTLHLAEIGQRYLAALARKGSGAAKIGTASTTRTVGQGGKITGDVNAKLNAAPPEDYVAMRRKQMAASK